MRKEMIIMAKIDVEKVGKIACYVGLGVCTLGKMFFDKKDTDKAHAKAFEEYMKRQMEQK
jgi:hypothetical protein